MEECFREVMFLNYCRSMKAHLVMVAAHKEDKAYIEVITSAMIGIIGFMFDCKIIEHKTSLEHTNKFLKAVSEIVNV